MATSGLTPVQAAVKRAIDLVGAVVGLGLGAPLIAAGWLAATLSTGESGFFRQTRIGHHGRPFRVWKLRTMRLPRAGEKTHVTTAIDPRITRVGALLRRSRLDELPQLINVLVGEMSLVGPRPDVPGFADLLTDEDRVILTVRPGITGPATLAHRDEEEVLAAQPDPERYNSEVLWPRKVRLNRLYVEQYSVVDDLRYLVLTLTGGRIDADA